MARRYSEREEVCKECGAPLTEENHGQFKTLLRRYVCNSCWNEKNTNWRNKDLVRVKEWGRSNTAKLRVELLAAYGGRCACCGEDTPEFLTVDHIRGNGAEHRRELMTPGRKVLLYPWLRRNGYPKDNFQLLCANCNMAKGRGKICPHARLSLLALCKEAV